MLQIMARNFYDATLWRKIAFQDDQTAGRLEGFVELAHDFLVRSFLCAGGFFGQGASSHGEGAAVENLCVEQPPRDQRSAARGVVVRSHKSATGLEVSEDGNARTDAVKIFDGK